MKIYSTIILSSIIAFSFSFSANAKVKLHGQKYCSEPGYECIKVKRGDSWEKLFDSQEKIDLVKRLNRMNTKLQTGQIIAVPKNLYSTTLRDISPFPHYSDYEQPTLVVDQSDLAWGAYSSSGKLLNWGPISGGKGYCPDVGRGCGTVKGEFTVTRKKNENCVSTKFPIGEGGAPMPYCMFFHGGFALHGSPVVPGYNASHGCVRLFVEDAKWLNQEFVDVGKTKVIVRP